MKPTIWPLLLSLCCAAAHAQVPLHVLESPTPAPRGGGSPGGAFGVPVVGVPDLDGDGHGDVAVGARREYEDIDIWQSGRVHVYSGATGDLLYSLDSPNPVNQGYFGLAVAGVPDLDGDERGDILVGASRERDGGNAYLFSGASGALLRTFTSPNAAAAFSFGNAVAMLPDADGDGLCDLLVGDSGEAVDGVLRAGRTYLYSGGSGEVIRSFISPNARPGHAGFFGKPIAAVPDADGDGFADVLIGARYEDFGDENDAGRAYLFSGASGALLHEFGSPEPEFLGGFSVALAGIEDLNGDGRGDLVVGAYAEGDGGRVYVYSGATGALLRIIESIEGGGFGFALSAYPDVDEDGRADLLVGAPFADGSLPNDGKVYLLSGASGAPLGTLASPAPEQSGSFGYALDLVTDADERAAVTVGAYAEDGGAEDAGRAYVFADFVPTASEPDAIAEAMSLSVAPNPSRASAEVRFTLPAPMAARLAVYDLLGREVARLLEGPLAAGEHRVRFDASALPAGVYVYRLETSGAVQARTLAVVR